MVFLFVFIMIIIIVYIIISLKINFKIEAFSYNSMLPKNVKMKYNILITIYIFNKIPIIKIKLTSTFTLDILSLHTNNWCKGLNVSLHPRSSQVLSLSFTKLSLYLLIEETITVLMSRSQFHPSWTLYLHMHGLIFNISI